MKTSIKLKPQDYISTDVFELSGVAMNPLKKVLEHVNELGLMGNKIKAINFMPKIVDISEENNTYSLCDVIEFESESVKKGTKC